MRDRWVELEGAFNVRDLGGLATLDGGITRFDKVIRADDLTYVSAADAEFLVDGIGVVDVIDLRGEAEVASRRSGNLGNRDSVVVHQMSLIDVRNTGMAGKALPWRVAKSVPAKRDERVAQIYLDYLTERPDSIIAALRMIAHGVGVTIVHCAAGKDRTGVVCALALDAAGVCRRAIVDDYVQSGERLDAVLDRLAENPIYRQSIISRSRADTRPQACDMERLLTVLDETYGSPKGWLEAHGWTDSDQCALSARIIEVG